MGSLYLSKFTATRTRRAFRHNENLWPYTKITRAAKAVKSARCSTKVKTVPLVSLSER